MTEPRSTTVWHRVGPVCGVLAAVTYVAGKLAFPLRGLAVRPEDSAERISAAMAERLQQGTEAGHFWRVTLVLLSVFFLLWFLGDVHRRLQARSDERSGWVATVFLAGGLALAAGLLIQGFVGLVQITIVDFGADVLVARMLLTLSWVGFAVVIPGAAAMTSAAAVLSLRFGALPAAVGVLGAIACAATFAVYWVPVWLLWVLVAAIVLLVGSEQMPEPASPATTQRKTR